MPYTEDPAELAGRRRGDRRRADRRPRLRPARGALRPARDPRRELPARAAPGGRGRRASRRCGWSTSATRRSCPPTRPPATRRSSAPSARSGRPGPMPIVLGGDHGIAEPDIRACARTATAPVGLVHFDTHTDTGARGLRRRGLARDADAAAGRGRRRRPGPLRPDRPARVLARRGGVRLAGRAGDRRASSCTTSASSASRRWSSAPWRRSARGPAFLSVDIDVLDPAFAPGTGTPEPGGMTQRRAAPRLPGAWPTGSTWSAPRSSR